MYVPLRDCVIPGVVPVKLRLGPCQAGTAVDIVPAAALPLPARRHPQVG